MKLCLLLRATIKVLQPESAKWVCAVCTSIKAQKAWSLPTRESFLWAFARLSSVQAMTTVTADLHTGWFG